jgi:hypothetical protein
MVIRSLQYVSLLLLCLTARNLAAEFPDSQLQWIFPIGAAAGTDFQIEIGGVGLNDVVTLYSPHPGITFQTNGEGQFVASIAKDVPAGRYTVQVLGSAGLSSSRLLLINDLPVVNETNRLEAQVEVVDVQLPVALQGAIGAKGDVDLYQFEAQSGQVLVLECWASRLDSDLRCVLELFDESGKRLAVNRGYFGTDAFVVVAVPHTGKYVVRVADLIFRGGLQSFYRLEIHDRPRVIYTLPAAVSITEQKPLVAYGYNLGDTAQGVSLQSRSLETSDLKVPANNHGMSSVSDSKTVGISIGQLLFPDALAPVEVALTEIPVAIEPQDMETEQRNNNVSGAEVIQIPIDITGRLRTAADVDWYALSLRQGEVVYIESFGQRIGSPIDLTVYVYDEDGKTCLATYEDVTENIGRNRFPTAHLDPSGRFVAPRDGVFHVVVRDSASGSVAAAQRIYRLVVKRESPALKVVAIHATSDKPSSLTLRRGGNARLDLLAFPANGLNTSVQVSAVGLPPGVHCDPVWIGPAVRQAVLVLNADQNAEPYLGKLELKASYQVGNQNVTQSVLSGTMSHGGTSGVGRFNSQLTLAVTDTSPVVAVAAIDRRRYQGGSVIDVLVTVDRQAGEVADEMVISGLGLPLDIKNRLQRIPTGNTGTISFYIPPSLSPGKYSIAAKVRTKMNPVANGKNAVEKAVAVELVTNTVSFEVYSPPYVVAVDLEAPVTIARGEVIQLKYSARRQDGFIGKIHTELVAPGGVLGIRGRGVTFVGQTDSGVIQIIANDDAPLGQQSGLRLEGIGTVEDVEVHRGSVFLTLEIVE